MDFNFIYNLELDNGEFELLVSVTGYQAGRPAPACSNPSSPLFSDPGSDPEFDDYTVEIFLKTGEDMFFIPVPTKLEIEISDIIINRIFEEGDKIFYEKYYD